MDGGLGVRELVREQRLQENIQSGLLAQATQVTGQEQENEDNLIRILISVGSVFASLGTLASGLLALALAKRVYDRGLEAACRAGEQARDDSMKQARTRL